MKTLKTCKLLSKAQSKTGLPLKFITASFLFLFTFLLLKLRFMS